MALRLVIAILVALVPLRASANEFSRFPWLVQVGSLYIDRAASDEGEGTCQFVGRGFIVEAHERYYVVTSAHLSQGELGTSVAIFDERRGGFAAVPILGRVAFNAFDVEVLEIDKDEAERRGLTIVPLAHLVNEFDKKDLWNLDSLFFRVGPEAGLPENPAALFEDRDMFPVALHSFFPAASTVSHPIASTIRESGRSYGELRDEARRLRAAKASSKAEASGNQLIASRLEDGFRHGFAELQLLTTIPNGMSGSPFIWYDTTKGHYYVLGLAMSKSRFFLDAAVGGHVMIDKAIRGIEMGLTSFKENTRWHCRAGLTYRWTLARATGAVFSEISAADQGAGGPLLSSTGDPGSGETGNQVGADGGNQVGADGGNQVGADGGNQVGADGGNQVGADGGNQVGADGGNQVGADGGNQVGADGGNQVGADGGDPRTRRPREETPADILKKYRINPGIDVSAGGVDKTSVVAFRIKGDPGEKDALTYANHAAINIVSQFAGLLDDFDVLEAYPPITLQDNVIDIYWRNALAAAQGIWQLRDDGYRVAPGFAEITDPIARLGVVRVTLAMKPSTDPATGEVERLSFRLEVGENVRVEWQLGRHGELIRPDGRVEPYSPIIDVPVKGGGHARIELFRILFQDLSRVQTGTNRKFVPGSIGFWLRHDDVQYNVNVTM